MEKNLPTDFVNEMRSLLGEVETASLCRALSLRLPPVSLRRNPMKMPAALPAAVQKDVPWCAEGVYLEKRPAFTFDPLLHAGCYYVQEAASMFVAQAFRKIKESLAPQRVLDFCAAPGGKSTLWRSLLPDGVLLVANEPVRQRACVLAENLAKWGHPDTVVTQAFPEEFASLGGFFDVVAADVPCSGEGMFRKDDTAVGEWSLKVVEACAARQWGIVESVWPALREGGFLVYSTCTFNRTENEDTVARICNELGAETVPIYILKEWGIAGDMTGRGLHVYHFFPHRTESEGFFMALLRKTSAAPSLREKKKRGESIRAVRGCAEASQWIDNAENFKIFEDNEGNLSAMRESLFPDTMRLTQALRCLTAGIPLSVSKAHKLIPQQGLALSTCFSPAAFPRHELTHEQALSYLRREAVTLPVAVPRGYVVMTYQGYPLGFVNNIGSRANNLYPQAWRIRLQDCKI